jgi:hypothetical protein
MDLEISTGWNTILSAEVHLRAATAGLRLLTSEAYLMSGKIGPIKKPEVGVLRFGDIPSEEKSVIRVPFNIETEVSDVAVKLEISYPTEHGTFFQAGNYTLPMALPLGVNVQDVFKHKALFSRFTISSASTSPLRLLASSLGESDVYEASKGGELKNPVVIFPKHP